jgi:hypothetical protein
MLTGVATAALDRWAGLLTLGRHFFMTVLALSVKGLFEPLFATIIGLVALGAFLRRGWPLIFFPRMVAFIASNRRRMCFVRQYYGSLDFVWVLVVNSDLVGLCQGYTYDYCRRECNYNDAKNQSFHMLPLSFNISVIQSLY